MFEHLKSMNSVELKKHLEQNASEIKEGSYFRRMSQEEITEARKTISDDSIALSELDEVKKDFMDTHKENCKPYKDRLAVSIDAVKTKQVKLIGKTYVMKSFEDEKVFVLDSNGTVLEERRMTPSERQADIYSINRTGTQD